MIYLGEKGCYGGKYICNIIEFYAFRRSHTSYNIYPRIASMTVFAVHPEAITLGWLL